MRQDAVSLHGPWRVIGYVLAWLVYLAALAAVALWPVGGSCPADPHSVVFNPATGYRAVIDHNGLAGEIENFGGNFVLMMPAALLLTAFARRIAPAIVAGFTAGLVLSLAVETVQYEEECQRVASAGDVALNVGGAFALALAIGIIRLVRQRRALTTAGSDPEPASERLQQ